MKILYQHRTDPFNIILVDGSRTMARHSNEKRKSKTDLSVTFLLPPSSFQQSTYSIRDGDMVLVKKTTMLWRQMKSSKENDLWMTCQKVFCQIR
jgi:hypothetical protein